MAFPTFVASSTDVIVQPAAGDGNGVMSKPAGVVTDDYLFFVLTVGASTGNTITPPSGFTLIQSQPASLFSSGIYVYGKVAGSSEPSTYTVNQTQNNAGRTRMYAYRGVNTTSPVNVSLISSAQGSVSAVALPNLPTTVAETVYIGVAFEYNGRTPVLSATGAMTDRGGSTATGLVFNVVEENVPTATTVSGKTESSSLTGDFYGFSMALAPAGGGGGDTTPPTLSSGVGTATGSTTATVGATTDEANGTMYVIVSTSSTPPSAAQIQAGQTNTGSAAPWSGNQTITTTGAKTFSATGLTASTTYYPYVQHKDAAGNNSTVLSGPSFTTSAGGDTTPPTLTSPTGTATGSTTASGTVSTNEANGTLYYLATTNSTETAATVKASGASQAVTATGTQNVSVTGLTASTNYYMHYVHRDAAGNDSTVSNSASFTTNAGGTLTIGVLKNNTGTVLASQTGITVHVYTTAGAFVVTKTGQTSNGSGNMTVTDGAINVGTTYRCVIILSSTAEGLVKVTAT